MKENIIVVLILYAAILTFDIPNLLQKKTKEKLAYALIMLPTMYLAYLFINGLTFVRSCTNEY
jgi:hypothetical protein